MRSFRLINCIIAFIMASGIVSAQAPIPELCNSMDSLGLYNININIHTNHFCGLLLLKRINDSTIRLVMNSEMGPKLIDMVFYPSGYKVLYAFPKLNHKRTLRTFYEDFGALSGILTRKRPFIVENTPDVSCYTYDLRKRMKIIYIVDSLSHKLISGRFEKGKIVKSIFYYLFAPGTTQINSMKIEHQHFKMIISLSKI
jgi:hypothetical protein